MGQAEQTAWFQKEIFEAKQRAMIAESKVTGYRDKLNKTLSLEMDGIRDIIEYATPEVKAAIIERLQRMERILNQEGE